MSSLKGGIVAQVEVPTSCNTNESQKRQVGLKYPSNTPLILLAHLQGPFYFSEVSLFLGPLGM